MRILGRNQIKVILSGLAFMAALSSDNVVRAQTPAASQPDPIANTMGSTMQSPPMAQAHNDKEGRYSLVVPPEATITERPNSTDIRIQSRKGYVINLQAGPNRPLSLEQMAMQLEERYLGENKPWVSKLASTQRPIAGMPGIENVYRGSGAKIKLIIARGKQNDFVMIFNGPERSFDTFESDFDFIETNFHPAKTEINKAGVEELLARQQAAKLGKQAKPETIPPKQEINPLLQPSMADKQAALNAPYELPDVRPQTGYTSNSPLKRLVNGKQQFFAPEYGYSIEFPGDWLLEKPGMYSLLISGQPGTEAYLATVGVQNVKPGLAGSYKEIVTHVVDGLKKEYQENGDNVVYYGEKFFPFQQGQIHMDGYQFLVTYNYEGQKFRKWVMLLPRARGGVVHIWSYTAPEAQFNTYRPVAEEILKSWSIQDNG